MKVNPIGPSAVWAAIGSSSPDENNGRNFSMPKRMLLLLLEKPSLKRLFEGALGTWPGQETPGSGKAGREFLSTVRNFGAKLSASRLTNLLADVRSSRTSRSRTTPIMRNSSELIMKSRPVRLWSAVVNQPNGVGLPRAHREKLSGCVFAHRVLLFAASINNGSCLPEG